MDRPTFDRTAPPEDFRTTYDREPNDGDREPNDGDLLESLACAHPTCDLVLTAGGEELVCVACGASLLRRDRVVTIRGAA